MEQCDTPLDQSKERRDPALRTAAPFVSESGGRLSLHFDGSDIQSLMDVGDPHRLLLDYTQTIMEFLKYCPTPDDIGMIGLGGGSLVKYCRAHLPQARMTVAEISAEIIGFRKHFLIPDDDEHLRIFCEDGADFVRRHRQAFDVLIVDGFDDAGQPPELCSQSFYDECRLALKPHGLLIVNICDSGRSILVARLRKSFAGQVFVIDGQDNRNTVAFAGSAFPPSRK